MNRALDVGYAMALVLALDVAPSLVEACVVVGFVVAVVVARACRGWSREPLALLMAAVAFVDAGERSVAFFVSIALYALVALFEWHRARREAAARAAHDELVVRVPAEDDDDDKSVSEIFDF